MTFIRDIVTAVQIDHDCASVTFLETKIYHLFITSFLVEIILAYRFSKTRATIIVSPIFLYISCFSTTSKCQFLIIEGTIHRSVRSEYREPASRRDCCKKRVNTLRFRTVL